MKTTVLRNVGTGRGGPGRGVRSPSRPALCPISTRRWVYGGAIPLSSAPEGRATIHRPAACERPHLLDASRNTLPRR
jgi:hypothetical protein